MTVALICGNIYLLRSRQAQTTKGERVSNKKILDSRIHGIGLLDKINGQTVTSYYFDEAISVLVDVTLDDELWRLSRFLDKNSDRILHVVLSRDAGNKFLELLGWERIRKDLRDPERFESEAIGSGSEGDVYAYNINGQAFAVKLFSEKAQHDINESYYAKTLDTYFPRPVFTNRIGFATSMVNEVVDWPKKNYSLNTLVEYAASRDFFVTEVGPHLNLEALMMITGLCKEREGIDTDLADAFIVTNGVRMDDLETLKEELERLDEACHVLQFAATGFFSKADGKHDLCSKNILVQSFNETSRHFELILIDQGRKEIPVFASRDSLLMEDVERQRTLSKFNQLNKNREYRFFFERRGVHVPTRPYWDLWDL